MKTNYTKKGKKK